MSAADEVKERRRQAMLRWQELGTAAGASACALAKNGVSFPAAKMAEGRVAALGEVQRALKKAGGTGSDAAAIAAAIRDRWAAERDGGDAARSRDWAAYRTGGADELEDLVAALGG